MTLFNTFKVGAFALLSGVALFNSAQPGYAGADWSGYTSWPSNPNGAYDPNKPAHAYTTSQDGAALKTAMQNAINSGAASYTVTPGVYKFTSSGPILNVLRHSNFTLNAGGCTFIMANSGTYLVSGYKSSTDTGSNLNSNITIQGTSSAPLVLDREPLGCQGKITSYVPATGILQVQVMTDYSLSINASGELNAYTSEGRDIPFGYYHSLYGKYTGGQVIDSANRIVQVTTDKNSIYAVGDFVKLPSPNDNTNSVCNFGRAEAKNLTLKYIANGSGGTLFMTAWGGALTGTTTLVGIKNGPIQGTNRLGVNYFAQTNHPGGSVVMDQCEFGGNDDDIMDIQANSFNMYYKTSASNKIVVWNLSGSTYSNNDEIALYATQNFANIQLNGGPVAHITNVNTSYSNSSELTDAANTWNGFTGAWGRVFKSGGSLVELTLDTPLTGAVLTKGDFIEDNSQRMSSFTMTNCYWHNSGMRVMIEGIKSGNFTHNEFEAVNGGLALVADPYWAQGGTCQGVTVNNNIFLNCKNDNNGNAHGALVLGTLYPPYNWSNPIAGQGYSFMNYYITNNTSTGTKTNYSLYARMVGNLHLTNNSWDKGQDIAYCGTN